MSSVELSIILKTTVTRMVQLGYCTVIELQRIELCSTR